MELYLFLEKLTGHKYYCWNCHLFFGNCAKFSCQILQCSPSYSYILQKYTTNTAQNHHCAFVIFQWLEHAQIFFCVSRMIVCFISYIEFNKFFFNSFLLILVVFFKCIILAFTRFFNFMGAAIALWIKNLHENLFCAQGFRKKWWDVIWR